MSTFTGFSSYIQVFKGPYEPGSGPPPAGPLNLNATEVWLDLGNTELSILWVSAFGSAPGTVTVFVANTAPTSGMVYGDLWVDCLNNTLYKWNGSSWGDLNNQSLAIALCLLFNSQDGIYTLVIRDSESESEGESPGTFWIEPGSGVSVFKIGEVADLFSPLEIAITPANISVGGTTQLATEVLFSPLNIQIAPMLPSIVGHETIVTLFPPGVTIASSPKEAFDIVTHSPLGITISTGTVVASPIIINIIPDISIVGIPPVITGHSVSVAVITPDISIGIPSLSITQGIAPPIFYGFVVIAPTPDLTLAPGAIVIPEVVLTPPAAITIDPRDDITIFMGIIHEIDDNLQAYDYPLPGWFASINESVLSVDDPGLQLLILLEDFTKTVDTLSPGFSSTPVISDTISISDISQIVQKYSGLIEEALSGVDVTSATVSLLVAEYLNARDAVLPLTAFYPDISDSIQAIDESVAHWFLSIADSLGVAGAVEAIGIIAGAVGESVSLEDVLAVTGIYPKSIAESLSASDLASFAWALTVNESLSIVDTISAIGFLVGLIAESLIAVETLSPVKRMLIAFDDTMRMVDASTANGTFGVTIAETLSINLFVVIEGEVYECFVLNTSAFHSSIYSGFNFNSYCTYNNRTFAAGRTGIVEITGDTDKGEDINTGVIFHETDFSMPETKKFRSAYLGVSGSDPVVVMESCNGERRVYSVSDRGSISASRAVKGKIWNLTVADFDILDSIKLIPVILSRGK